MTPRRESRWEHYRDTLRFVVRPSWKLIPAILVLGLLAYLLIHQMRTTAERPLLTKEARIVRFGVLTQGRILPMASVAVVRAADGTTSEVFANPEQMARCHVGDQITYTTGPEGTRIDRCTP
jgi:hypothetical protein